MKNYVAILLLSFMPMICFSNNPTMMVLNSDASVEKYAITQRSFVDKFEAAPIYPINLAEKKWQNLESLEEKIYQIYPDYVYCIGTKAYMIAQKIIPNKKIIFSSRASFYSAQEDNAIGIASIVHPGVVITTTKELLPSIKKLAVFHTGEANFEWFNRVHNVKSQLSIEFIPIRINDVSLALNPSDLAQKKYDAVFLLPDINLFNSRESVIKLLDSCKKMKIPVISYSENFISHPAVVLAVYVHAETVGSQIANIATKILKDAESPRGLSFSVGSSTTINLKHCNEIDVNVNLDNLDIADKVIQ